MAWDSNIQKYTQYFQTLGEKSHIVQVELFEQVRNKENYGVGMAIHMDSEGIPYNKEFGEALAMARARSDLLREEINQLNNEEEILKHFIWELKQGEGKNLMKRADALLASRKEEIEKKKSAKKKIDRSIQDLISSLDN